MELFSNLEIISMLAFDRGSVNPPSKVRNPIPA
jgi:hypothetical protein